MTQTIARNADLGPAYAGLTIGYRILNLNRTTYSVFTTTGVVENPAGWFSVNGGVVAPDAGGYIVWGPSGTDVAEEEILPAYPLLADYTAARAAKLDNLDATVSSRSTVTTAQVNAEADQALVDAGVTTTVTGRIDVAVSSRLASGSYTAPPTVAAVADAVWDEATTGHTTGGTFGEQVKTDIDAILDDTGTSGVVVATASKTGYELSATGVTAIWANATRTLTSFGTLANDVWAVATRTITGGTVTTNNDKTGYSLSSAGIQAIWDALTSALTTAGSVGKRIADNLDAAVSSRSTYAGGAVASVTGNVGGNVVGSVGSVTAAVTLADGAITAAKIATDAITAAKVAADAVAEIQSGLATASALSTVAGYIDTEVAAIKAKTDNLPSDPADASDVASAISAAQTAITNAIAALNNLSQAQAQSAAAAAIVDYDPPTKAELDSAVAPLATQASVDALPTTAAIAAAIMAESVMTGKSVEDVLRNVWSVVVGNSTADDGNNPTSIEYKDVDDSTDVTHVLTDTTRTVS